jgi:hypothetical protein
MRTGLKIIIYVNVEEERAYDFEDGVQAQIESTFESNPDMEIEDVEFEYPE